MRLADLAADELLLMTLPHLHRLLDRAHAGEDPDLVIAEAYANSRPASDLEDA